MNIFRTTKLSSILLILMSLTSSCGDATSETEEDENDVEIGEQQPQTPTDTPEIIAEPVPAGGTTIDPTPTGFTPATAPPATTVSGFETIEIANSGTLFDFKNALTVGTFSTAGLLQSAKSDFKKITGVGTVSDIALTARKIRDLVISPKNRIAVLDDSNGGLLVDPDGTETELAQPSYGNLGVFASDGTYYFLNAADQMVYKIENDSTLAVKLTNYPWDSMNIHYSVGEAIKYSGTSGAESVEFTYFQGVNFSFGNCNSGPVAAVGDVGLIFDDCSGNNFAYFDGTEIIKELIPGIQVNGGGFSHSNGAVLFGQGQEVLRDECGYSFGIVFFNTEKIVSPIGCAPPGFGGAGPWHFRERTAKVSVSGDLFVMKGTSEVWVYGINSWQQKILDGFTPIKLSLVGTTLYYDGLDNISGDYIVGKIDVVTRENTDLQLGGSLVDLIGFK